MILEGSENEIRQKDALRTYGCSCGDKRIITGDISNKVKEVKNKLEEKFQSFIIIIFRHTSFSTRVSGKRW